MRLLEKSGGRSGHLDAARRAPASPQRAPGRPAASSSVNLVAREGRAQEARGRGDAASSTAASRATRTPATGTARSACWPRRASTRCAPQGLDVGPGDFAENITTAGHRPLRRCRSARVCGSGAALARGHPDRQGVPHRCAIYYQAGDCVMPREGIFVRVLEGGEVQVRRRRSTRGGEPMALHPRPPCSRSGGQWSRVGDSASDTAAATCSRRALRGAAA